MQHPNGQIPACEWDFSKINPPLLAWSALRIFEDEEKREGQGDRNFLARCFHKNLMYFSWWVNRVDKEGNNVFEGGFLGLDNITIFDRNSHDEGELEQADGTGWMGMFCLVMMRIALKLAAGDSSYEPLAVLFFQHFVYIKEALHNNENHELQLWNEEDGFFYDVLKDKDGRYHQLKVRSAVGIIPLFATTTLNRAEIDKFPIFKRRFYSFIKSKNHVCNGCIHQEEKEGKNLVLFSLLNPDQAKRVLGRIFDENEFYGQYGVRSISKYHEKHPFEWADRTITYEPGESRERIMGGNSNWRGPVWFPINYLLIEAVRRYEAYLGPDFEIEAGSKTWKLSQLPTDLTRRLISIFKLSKGRRPYLGENKKLQSDEEFRDHLLFFEHFDPDTGRGLGASHQTGWTALVSRLIYELYSEN